MKQKNKFILNYRPIGTRDMLDQVKITLKPEQASKSMPENEE
jgi:hypothetical protein